MTRASIKPFLIGAGILAVGVLGLALLVVLRPEPPKIEPPRQSPLVTTVQPELRQGHLTVRGNGTARPIREINLVAEISGRVVSVSDALVSGGFFDNGQMLLQVDPMDYENAVAVAEAEVAQRQLELLMAQEEVEIAREEWARLEQRTGVKRSPDSTAFGSLVLKEPQLKAAQAMLKSADARLDDTRTRLARTTIAAPFDGRVIYAGQFRTYGRLLIIAHGEGYHTLLAGLGKIDALVGQWVLAGEPVGSMARTRLASADGSTAGPSPELYLEIRKAGEPINPLPWLKK